MGSIGLNELSQNHESPGSSADPKKSESRHIKNKKSEGESNGDNGSIKLSDTGGLAVDSWQDLNKMKKQQES